MLKGEENIYERLEDLLSSLYIEIINDNNFKVKKKKNKQIIHNNLFFKYIIIAYI